MARYWTPFASTGKEQKLIKTGIYAKVRHPIYLSGLILSLGFTLIAGNLYDYRLRFNINSVLFHLMLLSVNLLGFFVRGFFTNPELEKLKLEGHEFITHWL